MSNHLSCDLSLPAAQLPALQAALADCVVPDEGVASVDEALAAMFQRLLAAPGTEECLTFEFAPDPGLLAFRHAHPDLRPRTPGHVAVGCFWTSAKYEGDDLLVSFTSATGDIAELMRSSPSVIAVFVELACKVHGVAHLVDEWQAAMPLSTGLPG